MALIKNAVIFTENRHIEGEIKFDHTIREIIDYSKKRSTSGNHDEIFDVDGRLVIPGLTECHTHSIFAGSRIEDFRYRVLGKSYEEIAKMGYGIGVTVKSTVECDDVILKRLLKKRIEDFVKHGITTLEIKSGYGLLPEQELRLLRIIKEVDKETYIDIIPTLLALHKLPEEYSNKREYYIDLTINETIEEAAEEGLALFCDCFCEPGIAFSVDECRKVLKKAHDLGLGLKIHADQIKKSGGAELALELGCISADHLDHTSWEVVKRLSISGTIPVFLPGAAFFSGSGRIRNDIDFSVLGENAAISTDFNPGSSPTKNLFFMTSLYCLYGGLNVEGVIDCISKGPSRALGLHDRGEITVGKKADLVVLDLKRTEEIPYYYAENPVYMVVKSGIVIYIRDKKLNVWREE